MQNATYLSARACFPLERYFLGRDHLLYGKHKIHKIRTVHATLLTQDEAYARYTNLVKPYLEERIDESKSTYSHSMALVYKECYNILEGRPESLGDAVAVIATPLLSIVADSLYPIESDESLQRDLEEAENLPEDETLKGEALKVKTAEILLPLHKGVIFVANFVDMFNARGLNLAPTSNAEPADSFKQLGDIVSFVLDACEKVFLAANPRGGLFDDSYEKPDISIAVQTNLASEIEISREKTPYMLYIAKQLVGYNTDYYTSVMNTTMPDVVSFAQKMLVRLVVIYTQLAKYETELSEFLEKAQADVAMQLILYVFEMLEFQTVAEVETAVSPDLWKPKLAIEDIPLQRAPYADYAKIAILAVHERYEGESYFSSLLGDDTETKRIKDFLDAWNQSTVGVQKDLANKKPKAKNPGSGDGGNESDAEAENSDDDETEADAGEDDDAENTDKNISDENISTGVEIDAVPSPENTNYLLGGPEVQPKNAKGLKAVLAAQTTVQDQLAAITQFGLAVPVDYLSFLLKKSNVASTVFKDGFYSMFTRYLVHDQVIIPRYSLGAPASFAIRPGSLTLRQRTTDSAFFASYNLMYLAEQTGEVDPKDSSTAVTLVKLPFTVTTGTYPASLLVKMCKRGGAEETLDAYGVLSKKPKFGGKQIEATAFLQRIAFPNHSLIYGLVFDIIVTKAAKGSPRERAEWRSYFESLASIAGGRNVPSLDTETFHVWIADQLGAYVLLLNLCKAKDKAEKTKITGEIAQQYKTSMQPGSGVDLVDLVDPCYILPGNANLLIVVLSLLEDPNSVWNTWYRDRYFGTFASHDFDQDTKIDPFTEEFVAVPSQKAIDLSLEVDRLMTRMPWLPSIFNGVETSSNFLMFLKSIANFVLKTSTAYDSNAASFFETSKTYGGEEDELPEFDHRYVNSDNEDEDEDEDAMQVDTDEKQTEIPLDEGPRSIFLLKKKVAELCSNKSRDVSFETNSQLPRTTIRLGKNSKATYKVLQWLFHKLQTLIDAVKASVANSAASSFQVVETMQSRLLFASFSVQSVSSLSQSIFVPHCVILHKLAFRTALDKVNTLDFFSGIEVSPFVSAHFPDAFQIQPLLTPMLLDRTVQNLVDILSVYENALGLFDSDSAETRLILQNSILSKYWAVVPMYASVLYKMLYHLEKVFQVDAYFEQTSKIRHLLASTWTGLDKTTSLNLVDFLRHLESLNLTGLSETTETLLSPISDTLLRSSIAYRLDRFENGQAYNQISRMILQDQATQTSINTLEFSWAYFTEECFGAWNSNFYPAFSNLYEFVKAPAQISVSQTFFGYDRSLARSKYHEIEEGAYALYGDADIFAAVGSAVLVADIPYGLLTVVPSNSNQRPVVYELLVREFQRLTHKLVDLEGQRSLRSNKAVLVSLLCMRSVLALMFIEERIEAKQAKPKTGEQGKKTSARPKEMTPATEPTESLFADRGPKGQGSKKRQADEMTNDIEPQNKQPKTGTNAAYASFFDQKAGLVSDGSTAFTNYVVSSTMDTEKLRMKTQGLEPRQKIVAELLSPSADKPEARRLAEALAIAKFAEVAKFQKFQEAFVAKRGFLLKKGKRKNLANSLQALWKRISLVLQEERKEVDMLVSQIVAQDPSETGFIDTLKKMANSSLNPRKDLEEDYSYLPFFTQQLSTFATRFQEVPETFLASLYANMESVVKKANTATEKWIAISRFSVTIYFDLFKSLFGDQKAFSAALIRKSAAGSKEHFDGAADKLRFSDNFNSLYDYVRISFTRQRIYPTILKKFVFKKEEDSSNFDRGVSLRSLKLKMPPMAYSSILQALCVFAGSVDQVVIATDLDEIELAKKLSNAQRLLQRLGVVIHKFVSNDQRREIREIVQSKNALVIVHSGGPVALLGLYTVQNLSCFVSKNVSLAAYSIKTEDSPFAFTSGSFSAASARLRSAMARARREKRKASAVESEAAAVRTEANSLSRQKTAAELAMRELEAKNTKLQTQIRDLAEYNKQIAIMNEAAQQGAIGNWTGLFQRFFKAADRVVETAPTEAKDVAVQVAKQEVQRLAAAIAEGSVEEVMPGVGNKSTGKKVARKKEKDAEGDSSDDDESESDDSESESDSNDSEDESDDGEDGFQTPVGSPRIAKLQPVQVNGPQIPPGSNLSNQPGPIPFPVLPEPIPPNAKEIEAILEKDASQFNEVLKNNAVADPEQKKNALLRIGQRILRTLNKARQYYTPFAGPATAAIAGVITLLSNDMSMYANTNGAASDIYAPYGTSTALDTSGMESMSYPLLNQSLSNSFQPVDHLFDEHSSRQRVKSNSTQ